MIIYWDFDGVLVDTWEIINAKKEELKLDHVWEFFSTLNWKLILSEAKTIASNCDLLKKYSLKYPTEILTHFSSYEEAYYKTQWLMKFGNGFKIVFVPYGIEKHTFVKCAGNILIDDKKSIINKWIENKGIGIVYTREIDLNEELKKRAGEYIDKNDYGG